MFEPNTLKQMAEYAHPAAYVVGVVVYGSVVFIGWLV